MYYVCFQLNCHFHQSTSSTRRVRADASSLKRQGSVITGELDTPRALFRALTPLMCVIHWSGVRDWGQDKITRKLTNPWHEFPCQISRDPRGVHERKIWVWNDFDEMLPWTHRSAFALPFPLSPTKPTRKFVRRGVLSRVLYGTCGTWKRSRASSSRGAEQGGAGGGSFHAKP